MDWIPILSQAKSLVQVICGDAEGAKQTQENFLKTCPIVSQGTSLVQSISGDDEAALETQKAFGRTMSGVANGIPVVGHVKGVIHYACGDDEGGDQAMKSSSRTIGVMGGGVGGFFVGGPVGAVAGGIAGGAAMDGITTGIDSAVHGEYRPAGHIATVTEIVNSDKNPSGKIFDLTAGVVFDGLSGQAAGKAAGQIANNIKANNIRANAQSAFEQVENNPATNSGELASAGKTVMTEMKRADAVQGIKTDFTKFGETVQTKPAVFSEPTFVLVNEDNENVECNSKNSHSTQQHKQTTKTSNTTNSNNNKSQQNNNTNTKNNNNNNSAQNNSNNNNNNNNNNGNNTSTTTKTKTTDRRTQVVEWFNGLNTGISINHEHEIDRLVQVRTQMDNYLSRNPRFLNVATRFAQSMRPRTVSQFCSLLKFFENIFLQQRDVQRETDKRKPWKQAGEEALDKMTDDFMKNKYEEAKKIVQDNKMVYQNSTTDSTIRIDMGKQQLINRVRTEASNSNVRFGSIDSALYHMLAHPVYPLGDYVIIANRLVASASRVNFTINNNGTIDIEFTDPATGNYCVVLVKNGSIILKTFIPKQKPSPK